MIGTAGTINFAFQIFLSLSISGAAVTITSQRVMEMRKHKKTYLQELVQDIIETRKPVSILV
ncbi:hypothetical protein CM15mP5_1260 [bacterium]|nr:MAG: hypothetical protein CM15mP5_1260 [bacterium]